MNRPADAHMAKTCLACGRKITWRKKWARDWPSVKFCSNACRKRHGDSDADKQLEAAIVGLLRERAAGKTICPSEAARAVAGDDEARWRPLMEPARAAARRLSARGVIEIVQAGRIVPDPSRARGPIRLRRK